MGTLSNKRVAVLSALAVACVSWLAWHVSQELVPLTILFPALALNQRSRISVTAMALAYHGVSSFPVVQMSTGYFGVGNIFLGILLWAVASAILALPWIVLWHRDRDQITWRLPAALLVLTVPPVGIIGWASPLTAAGILFPGLGWSGILLMVIACLAVTARWWNIAMGLAVVALAANLLYKGPRPPTSTWVAVNTEFGSIRASDDPAIEFSTAEQIQRMALDAHARVIVFPELVVRRWGESTDLFWEPTLEKLRTRGNTVLVGAGSASSVSPDEFLNTVIIRGADEPSRFEQRIPVPLAMWKPWGGKDRVPLNLLGPSVVKLAGDRAAILICYEQLIPWCYLSAAAYHPTIFVGLSNAYWTRSTVTPKYQDAGLRIWGRLFGIPAICATNY
jgi:apolipoprotein N-acyltransferase